ncbi:MAG: peptide chain release factor N(5)-glutamine methyltransferase [Spirochaetota bacterium]|nr:peptide chain release factor N(5)-glutamine methyltransferase [Spirochaetota bacterium]
MILSDVIKGIILQFQSLDIENPGLDAEVILSHVLKIERFRLITEREKNISETENTIITELVQRRLRGEPVAYLIGYKEFYSLNFQINRDVLIPRPETELLVDLVIYYAKKDAKILDIGTGSGAIAIAIKHNRPDVDVTASDISQAALIVASKNAERILNNDSINCIQSDLFQSLLNKRFDIIVTNPPYLDIKERKNLQKEISFEPEIALFAHKGGKEVIRRIISGFENYLHINGLLLIEINPNFKDYIKDLCERRNLSIDIFNDYAIHPRVAAIRVK